MDTRDALVTFKLYVQPPSGADDDRRDVMTRRLQREIRDLNVDRVERVDAGPLPAGAKSAGAFALGEIAVTLGPAVVQQLFSVIQSWLSRPAHAGTSIQVEIEGRKVTIDHKGKMTPEQIQELVRAAAAATGVPAAGA